MPEVDDATARTYRAAWAAWGKQIEHVHRVFLEGAAIDPAALKGLLNREVRAWQAYESARQELLGLKKSAAEANPDANPFR